MRDPPLTDVLSFHTEDDNHNLDGGGKFNTPATGDVDSTQTGGAAVT